MKSERIVEIDAIVRYTTDDAMLLDVGKVEQVWVPNSLVENNNDGTVSMPEWLAIEKELV